MSELPTHKAFALRYATMAVRTRRDNFIFTDDHEAPMPIDYFVWAIQNADRAIVIDTGFNKTDGERRGRTFLRNPADLLKLVGIEAGAVRDVIVTHMHFDHIGNIDLFPAATFHLQDKEIAYATGRYMCHQVLSHVFDVEHVTSMVRRVYAGRVRFHDGEAQIAPGSPSIVSAAIPAAYRLCAYIPSAAGSCSPRMHHTLSKTELSVVHSQSC
jgi:glyoxylase-like metal-dependent hydrolase (beta-lactamase superfamily II)